MRNLRLAGMLLVAVALSIPGQTNAREIELPAPSASDQADVYQALAPYGDWLYMRDFGWVWRPSEREVGEDFEPYITDGNWEYTDAGWYWNSDWSWGWLPFHYGRWLL